MTIPAPVIRLLFLTLLWLILTRAEPDSLVLGIPFIALAYWALARLSHRPQPGLQVAALLRFAPWFIWNSVKGGVDVARRALSPEMPLNPGFVTYPLSIPPGRARVFLINCVSLLPGTLSAEVDGDNLLLHALDSDMDIAGDTRAVEKQVQALFNLSAHKTDE